jgi:hypothetical protein
MVSGVGDLPICPNRIGLAAPLRNICCRIVTVQPKSKSPFWACREVEQRLIIVLKRALAPPGFQIWSASDRRKKPIKTGINIPPAIIRELSFSTPISR